MAKLRVSSMLATLIMGTLILAMVQPGLGQDSKVVVPPKKHHHHHHHTHHHSAKAPTPEESPEERYLDSIPQKVKDFIDNCTKSITPDCGEEIVGSLFNARSVHSKCCRQLVDVGEKCHKTIVKVFAGMPDVKQAEGIIKANSHKVFRYCVNLVKKEHKGHKAKGSAKGPAHS